MKKKIYDIIKNRILFLDYSPGTILNENILCKEFNVSRTPLREALNRLENEHLVRIFPRMGTMVTEIEFQQMMDALQVRAEVEGLLGALSARQITDAQIAQLKKIERSCADLTEQKNKKKLAQLDMDFRRILFDASQNKVLVDVCHSLYELTLRLWVITMDKGDWREEVEFICREMRSLIEILECRSPKDAAKTKRDFLSFHYDRISEKFLKHGH